MTPLLQTPGVPSIQTREQLEAVVENIVQLQFSRAELEREQENEIAAVRQKFRIPLAELESFLKLETAWVEKWARDNPGELDENRSLACGHATLGFRDMPPRVERASRKWTWTAASQKLAEVPWGARYLHVPAPEVDKEAVLSDFGNVSPEELRNVGLKIVQGERFFITPHGHEETAPVAESTWQEAA